MKKLDLTTEPDWLETDHFRTWLACERAANRALLAALQADSKGDAILADERRSFGSLMKLFCDESE